jgi:hypothetical protein
VPIEPDHRAGVPGAPDARVLLAAVRAGVRRALRNVPGADADEAVGAAVARIVARRASAPTTTAARPDAYAAACGRHAALDALRANAARRSALARLAAAAAHDASPGALFDMPFGWAWPEVAAQARSAQALVRAELRRSPSRELCAVALALGHLLAGRLPPTPAGDAERRRLDRGIARLARLMG